MSKQSETSGVTRRDFLHTGMAGAAAWPSAADALIAASDQDSVVAEIARQHDATVKMLRDWIALPSIAAENRNYPQGAEYMAKLARDAGFHDASTSCPPRANPASSRRSTTARDHARDLLHVRREAVRPDGVELAAARRRGSSIGPASARSWSAAARPTPRVRRSRASPRCMPSRRPDGSCRSTSSSSAKARRRSDRRTSGDRVQARGRGRAAQVRRASSSR